MSNILRSIKRQANPHYTCCKKPMLYMPDQEMYVCEKCGKSIKKKKATREISMAKKEKENKKDA